MPPAAAPPSLAGLRARVAVDTGHIAEAPDVVLAPVGFAAGGRMPFVQLRRSCIRVPVQSCAVPQCYESCGADANSTCGRLGVAAVRGSGHGRMICRMSIKNDKCGSSDHHAGHPTCLQLEGHAVPSTDGAAAGSRAGGDFGGEATRRGRKHAAYRWQNWGRLCAPIREVRRPSLLQSCQVWCIIQLYEYNIKAPCGFGVTSRD